MALVQSTIQMYVTIGIMFTYCLAVPQSPNIASNRIKQIKERVLNDPFSHPGTTFQSIDCNLYNGRKQKVLIETGGTPQMIITYFRSRCDFEIHTRPPRFNFSSPAQLEDPSKFDLIYTHYYTCQDPRRFVEGQQLSNHIPNLGPQLSNKRNIIQTLFDFDKERPYPEMNSKNFFLQTFTFNLTSSEYTESELYFMDNVKDGYWVTKDPKGSQGIGIKLFRGVDQIQKEISRLKASKLTQAALQVPEINMYSVVQRYLEKPFLIQHRKFQERIFGLIASVNPLVILAQPGPVHICIEKFDLDFKDFSGMEVIQHLTNLFMQEKHPQYDQVKQDIAISHLDYQEKLKKQFGFSTDKIESIRIAAYQVIAYSILAAKKDLTLKRGYYQLLGIDFLYDENFNPWLTQYNTSTFLYQDMNFRKITFPQLIQSTYDLIIKSHENPEKLVEFWQNPQINAELGRWRIIYNQATGYNILNEVKYKNEDPLIHQDM